jgi:hypothetical protein
LKSEHQNDLKTLKTYYFKIKKIQNFLKMLLKVTSKQAMSLSLYNVFGLSYILNNLSFKINLLLNLPYDYLHPATSQSNDKF